ncbi:hypothetical protein M422DRAFT_57427 [Sphaerobolus stellatus SS14]|nr:hypothetical protein M422DRAFT_57427 [Sphaerobolus stellatus SS14]
MNGLYGEAISSGAKKSVTLPPGPKGLATIGNLFSLPQSVPWKTYAKWGEPYGGILHISALGTHLVILNDPKYAEEMLDKKGRLYSERPRLMMTGELLGWGEGPALINFNSTWSEYRRLMALFMGSRNRVAAFNGLFQKGAHELVRRMLSGPPNMLTIVQSAIVIFLAYGYKASDEHDSMVNLASTAINNFPETTVTNAFLVDAMPILQYVPEWFPGATWKKNANQYRKNNAAGTAEPCFVTNILNGKELELSAKDDRTLQWTAAGIYSGVFNISLSTVAGMLSFMVSLAGHPHVLEKIHAEMESVLGKDRLPTLDDRPNIPYLKAAYLESIRKYPIAPFVLPHVAREDDIHDGYFIPKGTFVLPNIWQFTRDTKTYPEPKQFIPERFKFLGNDKQRDPKDFVFGYGRQ